MKKFTSLALIGAIVAGVGGFISLDASSATPFMTIQGTSNIHETGLMIGHVTYEVKGPDGQIKHYFQSDNIIVDDGTDCAAQAIFDDGNADVCTLGGNGGFAFIAIGNGTNPVEDASQTALTESGGGSAEFGNNGGGEMQRSALIDADITAADDAGGLDTVVSIATTTPFTFANLGPDGTTVTQSGLFDDGAAESGNMFAIRNISPGTNGLDVTNADTLSVTWTITLT